MLTLDAPLFQQMQQVFQQKYFFFEILSRRRSATCLSLRRRHRRCRRHRRRRRCRRRQRLSQLQLRFFSSSIKINSSRLNFFSQEKKLLDVFVSLEQFFFAENYLFFKKHGILELEKNSSKI